MYTSKRHFAARSISLALLTFCLITMKVVAACVDGPAEVRFGFPLAWITPGPTSLSFRIDPLALVIDFSVYLGVWWLLLRTALLMKAFSWRPRLLSAGL